MYRIPVVDNQPTLCQNVDKKLIFLVVLDVNWILTYRNSSVSGIREVQFFLFFTCKKDVFNSQLDNLAIIISKKWDHNPLLFLIFFFTNIKINPFFFQIKRQPFFKFSSKMISRLEKNFNNISKNIEN